MFRPIRRLPLTRALHTARRCQASAFGEPFEWDHERHWRDALFLDDQLTEDERLLRDAAAQFREASLTPRVLEHFRKEEGETRQIMKEMGSAGLLGVNLPEKYGCAGASTVSYGLVAREVERCDSGYRSAMSVQSSLVMNPINLFGSEELKDRLLPSLASGDLIGCFGLTEPDHGSDPAGMETKAIDKGDHFLVSGSKNWITNSPIADVFVVWAVEQKSKRVQGFVLEKGMAGLTAPKIEGKFSLRASPTGMIMMDEVKVPKGNHLSKIDGMRGPFNCLNSARLGIAWGALGAAEDCLDRTRQYTLDRIMFKRPIAANQLIQFKFANALTEISVALQATLRATRLKDEGKLHSNIISMMKRNSCIKALAVARECRDMLGGNGIVDEYGVIRHMLNLEAVNTYEGTQDIHALILGKAVTGIAAFR